MVGFLRLCHYFASKKRIASSGCVAKSTTARESLGATGISETPNEDEEKAAQDGPEAQAALDPPETLHIHVTGEHLEMRTSDVLVTSEPEDDEEEDIVDVTSPCPVPDLGQTSHANLFLQSYFQPPDEMLKFPFRLESASDSEVKIVDEVAATQAICSQSNSHHSSNGDDVLVPGQSNSDTSERSEVQGAEPGSRHRRRRKHGKHGKKHRKRKKRCKKCEALKRRRASSTESSAFMEPCHRPDAAGVPTAIMIPITSRATPSTASSSGVSEMSDCGTSSAASSSHSSNASRRFSGLDEIEESETSDYQRSTPSPREEDIFAIGAAAAKGDQFKTTPSDGCSSREDLGLGDEIKEDEEDLEREAAVAALLTFPHLMKRKKKKKKKDKKKKERGELRLPCQAASDPKLVQQEARVSLNKVVVKPKKEIVVPKLSSSSNVNEKQTTAPQPPWLPKSEEKKMRKRRIEDNVHTWFAKRSCLSAPTTPEKKPACSLIRPAILNVKSPSSTMRSTFSSHTTSSMSSSSGSADPSKGQQAPSNNPFLPPPAMKCSSYLFGGADDFEQADELVIMSEDDEEHDSEAELPVLKREVAPTPAESTLDDENKEYFEREAPTLQEVDRLIARDLAHEESKEQDAQKIDLSVPPKLERIKADEPPAIETKAEPPPKIRFPAKQGSCGNRIECKWNNCQMSFTSYGKLSDHLKACHVIGQLYEQQQHLESHPGSDEVYKCLWEGCKVFGKRSCSSSWLEKHVPIHGGKFAFACIVDGCKMRFSSQNMLQRHVNSHFSKADGKSASTVDAQSLANTLSESSKNLKRAGVKLKFRRDVFSARIFDFFDVGIMAGIKHGIFDLEQRAPSDSVTFKPTVKAQKTDPNGDRRVQVSWTPSDILPDEWMAVERVPRQKTVRIAELSAAAKAALSKHLFGQERPAAPRLSGASKRKQKSS